MEKNITYLELETFRCKIMICMVKTNPDAEPFRQQSQILIPLDTPGLEIVQPMTVFGQDEAPKGHMHIRMTNVKVPKENVLWGEGKGFEISQVRLGPGRIHLHAIYRPGRKGLGPTNKPWFIKKSFW